MTRYAYAERLALIDRMAQVGPEAPTLCTGWTVRDLAAHMYLRERRPDAAAGILVRRLAPRTERVQREVAAGDFDALLRRLRKPPWWTAPLDERLNLMEMFVHHEDVRRAQPGWEQRTLSEGEQRALFGRLRWRKLHRFPAVIQVAAPGFGATRAGGNGPDVITITGEPGELLLFLIGRQAHACVMLEGPPAAVDHLTRARLGL